MTVVVKFVSSHSSIKKCGDKINEELEKLKTPLVFNTSNT